MEPKHQNLKNKLEKLNGLEGVFGIFAYENDEKIYTRYPTKEVLENADEKLLVLFSGLDDFIADFKLSLKESVIQFSKNFKIILLKKKVDEHNYKLCFLTSRYTDVISIRRYID